MKKVVFVNELKHHKVIEVSSFDEFFQEQHKEHFDGNAYCKGYKWGDFLYRFNNVSLPFNLFNDIYQIIELKQVGYFFITETSEDGKTWERLDVSKSYFTYDNCYNEMKREAMESLGNEINIEDDFDFSEENEYKSNVIFGHDFIQYSFGHNIRRFRLYGE